MDSIGLLLIAIAVMVLVVALVLAQLMFLPLWIISKAFGLRAGLLLGAALTIVLAIAPIGASFWFAGQCPELREGCTIFVQKSQPIVYLLTAITIFACSSAIWRVWRRFPHL